MQPPYKSPNNNWYTYALFYDMSVNKADSLRPKGLEKPVFTFYDDREGYINGARTFVEERDPTGYKWATKYLGSWEHWKVLMNTKWFPQVYENWKEELQTKLAAEAIEQIQKIAISDGQQALIAAKYLAEKGWERRHSPSSRGRPTKSEVQGKMAEALRRVEIEDEDAARIGLKVVR